MNRTQGKRRRTSKNGSVNHGSIPAPSRSYPANDPTAKQRSAVLKIKGHRQDNAGNNENFNVKTVKKPIKKVTKPLYTVAPEVKNDIYEGGPEFGGTNYRIVSGGKTVIGVVDQQSQNERSGVVAEYITFEGEQQRVKYPLFGFAPKSRLVTENDAPGIETVHKRPTYGTPEVLDYVAGPTEIINGQNMVYFPTWQRARGIWLPDPQATAKDFYQVPGPIANRRNIKYASDGTPIAPQYHTRPMSVAPLYLDYNPKPMAIGGGYWRTGGAMVDNNDTVNLDPQWQKLSNVTKANPPHDYEPLYRKDPRYSGGQLDDSNESYNLPVAVVNKPSTFDTTVVPGSSYNYGPMPQGFTGSVRGPVCTQFSNAIVGYKADRPGKPAPLVNEKAISQQKLQYLIDTADTGLQQEPGGERNIDGDAYHSVGMPGLANAQKYYMANNNNRQAENNPYMPAYTKM